MTELTDQLVDVFARSGLLCAKAGVLPEALAELELWLDAAGHRQEFDQLVATRWETDPRYTDAALAEKKPTNPVPPPNAPKPTPAPKNLEGGR